MINLPSEIKHVISTQCKSEH